MSGRTTQRWIQDADKLLADGEWHDGWAWIQAVEKKILPAVAARHLEDTRTAQAARRHGVPKEEAPGRVKPLSIEAQVAAGKRDMTRALVSDRVRMGAYEVRPWPMPDGGWKQGGWEVRLIPRYTPNSLRERYGISSTVIRDLILTDPPLPHRDTGSNRLQITGSNLPELDKRVEVYKAECRERRRQGATLRWTRWRGEEQQYIPATSLAERSHLTNETVVRLLVDHPELEPVRSGRRIWRLPIAKLDAWDQIVSEYMSSRAGWRSARSSRAAASRRGTDPESPPLE